jgi:transcriptional regulator with XRE-family HTH domain
MREVADANELLNQIELVRQERGLSMKQLAEAAGLSRATYWNWHRYRKPPSFQTVVQIARVLGIRVLIAER